MTTQVQVSEEDQVLVSIRNAVDGVFVSCRSSFIITDDLKVSLNSIDELFSVVNSQGFPGLSELREMLFDVGSEEVLNLLCNLFTSESPLTCTFLKKQSLNRKLTSPMLKTGRVEQNRGCCCCYVKLFVGKSDRKIHYAECSEDFIDSLLTFLVLPLELAPSFSYDNTILGCVRNLCRGGRRRDFFYNRGLPDYYTCSKKLLDTCSCPSLSYECLIPHPFYSGSSLKFSRRIERPVLGKGEKIVTVKPMDPKNSRSGTPMTNNDIGFVKRKTKFIVSDDLIITPMNKFSTIDLLKKMQIEKKNLEAYSICIYQAELINILNASLTSSSALTNGLSYLLAKEPKKET